VRPERVTGAVALDIGEGHGALIVHASEDREGDEVEVVRDVDGWRTHVAVLARERGDAVAYAAVFGSLPEGSYRLLGAGPPRAVQISGGEITEVEAS
jgi:hypothetical protein